MKIGIDLDSVMFPFSEAFQEVAADRGHGDMDLPTSWRFFEDWGWTEEFWMEEFLAGINEHRLFSRKWPMSNSVEVFNKLKDEGHSLHIVTARTFGTKSMSSTEDWLLKHNIAADSVTFSHDKTVVYTDLFIEDNLANLDALTDAGTVAVAYDQPWNQEFDGPRVYDWIEFYSFAREIAKEIE